MNRSSRSQGISGTRSEGALTKLCPTEPLYAWPDLSFFPSRFIKLEFRCCTMDPIRCVTLCVLANLRSLATPLLSRPRAFLLLPAGPLCPLWPVLCFISALV